MRKLIVMLAASAIGSLARADGGMGLQPNVTFESYSPLSRSSELTQRILSPLMLMRVQKQLAQSGQTMSEQSIDLAHERFAIYVPTTKPADGYSLLVFVPPWKEAKIPAQWIAALDKHTMIFVTPANSGNDAMVIDRREPLALLATYNVMQKYSIDVSRVYVSGFSGGSRVALRLALAYPDLFRGALLEAGSDPIGDAQLPIPDAERFRQFRERSRIVYFTGRNDPEHLEQDAKSSRSLREWCVANIDTVSMPWASHEPADAASFNRALDALENSTPAAEHDSAACMNRIEDEMLAQLHEVETSMARGDKPSATQKLEKIDVRFGGLAAPRSVDLMKAIESNR
jgi:hypothetical protein